MGVGSLWFIHAPFNTLIHALLILEILIFKESSSDQRIAIEKGSDKEKTYNNWREEVANGNCDKGENSLPKPNAKSKVTIIEILTCF
jgi:hypothetical protein